MEMEDVDVPFFFFRHKSFLKDNTRVHTIVIKHFIWDTEVAMSSILAKEINKWPFILHIEIGHIYSPKRLIGKKYSLGTGECLRWYYGKHIWLR